MAENNPQRWTDELYRNGRLVLKSSRGKMVLILLLAVGFTIVGAVLISAGGVGAVAGIAAVLFFGLLGIPAIGWRLVTGRPVTIIDGNGVRVDKVGLYWGEILGVRVFSAPTLIVLLDTTPEGEARLTAQRSGWQQRLGHLNSRLTGHSSFALPSDQGVAAEPFAAWLAWLHAQRTGG